MNDTKGCEVAQQSFLLENPQILRQHYITRAILCDVQPACISELIFQHEYDHRWTASSHKLPRKLHKLFDARIQRCRNWRVDGDWPTFEPHLVREATKPQPCGFWETLERFSNRTFWIHGDSIQLQLCDAALCSLMRDGVAPAPVRQQQPLWMRQLSARTGLNFITTTLPNGARLMCSGIGVYQQEQVDIILESVDVALLNFGLHYNKAPAIRSMLESVMASLGRWQRARPQHRLALWREASAQHFPGGSYALGNDKPPPGTPCQCFALPQEGDSVVSGNLNQVARKLEGRISRTYGVRVVPFFSLSAPRYDMHRRHICSYFRQKTVGICCDCTHFCYTPLFWDAFFGILKAKLVGLGRFDSWVADRTW